MWYHQNHSIFLINQNITNKSFPTHLPEKLQRKFIQSLVLLSLLWAFAVRNIYAQAQTGIQNKVPPPTIQQLWGIREHFVYTVQYGPFTLGSVNLDVMPDSLYEGKECRYVRAIIKSNPALIFVGRRESIFSSLMLRNDTIPYDVLYWENNINTHQPREEVYRLDYSAGKVYVSIKGQPKDTLSLDKPSVCGPTFFFYTRVFAGTKTHLKVPLYINEKKNYITLNNSTKTQDIKCEAFKSGHVLTYVSHGKANFDGPFGFSGDYKAWYATGPMRLPVQAYLKVWLGHVKVRLIKYSVIK